MRNVWDGLEQCWEDFEALRHRRDQSEDFRRFISAWQVCASSLVLLMPSSIHLFHRYSSSNVVRILKNIYN
jgi:hypothetical protein